MSWVFGTIDFGAYGVMVSKSQGVLDLPKLRNQGHDWLDQDGLEYVEETPKYNDRDIVLNCWMHAAEDESNTGYANFQQKVSEFKTALKLQGKVSFQTPYVTINDCKIVSGVEIIRETSYVQKQQAGSFLLKITVLGDDPLQYFNVCRYSSENIIAVIGTKNMQVTRTLQGESYASCAFETDQPVSIEMYDYILINTNGVTDEPYYFFQRPEFKKVSSNKFQYNVRLDHGSTLLTNSLFLSQLEVDFYIYANLSEIVDLVVENSQRFIVDKFRKGTVDFTERRNHKFSGENCYGVIKRLAQEYGLEYDIRFGEIGPRYTINIVKQIATTKTVTLEYGKGNELYELTRQPIRREEFGTVLYAYGSTKNLKPEYRNGKRRLEFDGNPLKNNELVYMGVERHMFYDEIYPNRSAQVTAYEQILAVKEGETGWEAYKAIKEVWPGGMYKVSDTTLDFDINDHLVKKGLTAKIRMKTGDLAGFEFEIDMYDHDERAMYLIPYKDERGESFPNETQMISALDEYTLVDIDQPTTYVTQAESDLYDAASADLLKMSTPQYPYNALLQPKYLSTLTEKFEAGDRVTVADTDAGINGLYRISTILVNCYSGTYEFTLSEHRIYSGRERLDLRLKSVERAVKDTKKDTVESMRKEQETATELKNRLIDPADDLFAADRIVRKGSIDPGMLALDAGVPMWYVKRVIIEPNYNDDENALHVGSGVVSISNWEKNVLDRYGISKDRPNYDPIRSWNISVHDFALQTGVGYFMYVKLPLEDGLTTGTIEIDEEHVEAKRYIEDGYIYYKMAYVNPAESPRVVSALWGNVKVKSSTGAITIPTIHQVDHGFFVGCAIRHNGTIYVKAQADNDINAQTCGIVCEIVDPDNFKYETDGFIVADQPEGFWVEPGDEMFLSPTVPGLLIKLAQPETWLIGEVRQSLGWGTTRGFKVEIDVGDEISAFDQIQSMTFDKDFEFCIQEGISETFKLDFRAAYDYLLSRISMESDGTLNNISVKINGIDVTGLIDMDVSSPQTWLSTANNQVVTNDVVTLITSTSFSGTPTVLRVKMIYTIVE